MSIEELYKQGLSQSAVAKKLGISQVSVSRYLRARGICRGTRRGYSGRTKNAAGYWYIRVDPSHPFFEDMAVNSGYILEHRFKMAESLGRPLTRNETVHHIDGDRTNNDLSNLQLRQGRHGKGVVYKCRCCGSTDVELLNLQ